jgi:transcriptional regulator with XRE-family HTH domain
LKKLSQWELAQRASIIQTKVSLFERGHLKPSYDELKRIAEALEVDVKKLIVPISIEVREQKKVKNEE